MPTTLRHSRDFYAYGSIDVLIIITVKHKTLCSSYNAIFISASRNNKWNIILHSILLELYEGILTSENISVSCFIYLPDYGIHTVSI